MNFSNTYISAELFVCVYAAGVEPRASHILGKCSSTEPHIKDTQCSILKRQN